MEASSALTNDPLLMLVASCPMPEVAREAEGTENNVDKLVCMIGCRYTVQ